MEVKVMSQEIQTQGITLSEGAISAIREIQDKEQCQIHLEGLEKLLQFVIHNNDSTANSQEFVSHLVTLINMQSYLRQISGLTI